MKDGQAYEYNKLYESQLREICEPVIKLGFDIFFYTKIFLKCEYAFSLCTNLDYAKYFWSNNIICNNNFTNAINRSLVNKSYKLFELELNGNIRVFNLISIFDAFDRSDANIIENWGFASSAPVDRGIELYINNENLFRKFLNYFKYKSEHIIYEGIKSQAFYHTGALLHAAEDQYSSLSLKQLRDIQLKRLYIAHNGTELTLSKRQIQCLFYISKGYSLKEIAKLLDIAPISVEFHLNQIKIKANFHHKLELITLANKNFVDQCLP